ncbi:MAG TPA: hypothetical protein VIU62_22260 [Chloroflexota bacterium]|jgi:hypothetical protein
MPDDLAVVERSAAPALRSTFTRRERALAVAFARITARRGHGAWSPAEVANARRVARAFAQTLWGDPAFHRQRTPLMRDIAHAMLPRYVYISTGDIFCLALRMMAPADNHSMAAVSRDRREVIFQATPPGDPFVDHILARMGDALRLLEPPQLTPRERFWAAVALLAPADSPEALARQFPEISDGIDPLTGDVFEEPTATRAEHQHIRRGVYGAMERLGRGLPWDGRVGAGAPRKRPDMATRAGCEARVTATIAALLAEGASASVPNVTARLGLKSKRSLQTRLREHTLDWQVLKRKGAEMAAAQS